MFWDEEYERIQAEYGQLLEEYRAKQLERLRAAMAGKWPAPAVERLLEAVEWVYAATKGERFLIEAPLGSARPGEVVKGDVFDLFVHLVSYLPAGAGYDSPGMGRLSSQQAADLLEAARKMSRRGPGLPPQIA